MEPAAIIRRFVDELWNGRQLEVADEIFAADCITHQLRSGAPSSAVPRGPEAIKEHVSGWLRSFPDLRFTVEQIIAQNDRVATQLLVEGTHQAPWLGIPASGKTLQIRMFTLHRIAGDKIVEDWVLVESLGVFQQLGVIPSTPEMIAKFVHK